MEPGDQAEEYIEARIPFGLPNSHIPSLVRMGVIIFAHDPEEVMA
jgi:hypothetical protein